MKINLTRILNPNQVCYQRQRNLLDEVFADAL